MRFSSRLAGRLPGATLITVLVMLVSVVDIASKALAGALSRARAARLWFLPSPGALTANAGVLAMLLVLGIMVTGLLLLASTGALAMPTLVEKRQERGQHVESMRKLLDKAEGEKRALKPEEDVEYKRLDTEQERLGVEIKREERQAELDKELREARTPELRPNPHGDEGQRMLERIPERFRSLLAGATDQLRARVELLTNPKYVNGFRSYLAGGDRAFQALPETRDMQADLFVKGGAMVPPLEMIAGLIKNIDDQVYIRGLATKMMVTAADGVGVATLDTDVADAEWTSELKTGGNENSIAIGRREMRPHPLAKRTKISKKLLRLNPAAESLVLSRLAYKFGITLEKAYLTGHGAQQPLGIFTASADGIPTSRDVSDGNTTTAITADGLINAKYSLKAAYWPRLTWMFHRDAMKMIRKLKDGNGQYLWQPGLVGGIPDRVIETPFVMSEYVPATFTTGLYVGAIGDFSYYWIVDALDLTIQTLVELYAETNQNGYIGRLETDGQPVLAEAFARVKLA